MNHKKVRILVFFLTLLQAFLLRFYLLGTIPPMNQELFKGRLFSATVSFLTIPLIVFFTRQIYKNWSLSLLAGFWLSILPYSLEQGRINSYYPLVLFLLLLYFFIILKKVNLAIKIASSFAITGLILLLKPFWFQHQSILLQLSLKKILNNFFQQISFEFLFFKNESFWSGGFRNYGAIFPETIPIFLIGVYGLFKKIKVGLISVLYLFILAFIASLNAKFPETREFFFAIPIIVLILAIGTKKAYNFLIAGSFLKKLLIIPYAIILFYGFSQFFHFYLVHYNLRVFQEGLYKNEKF